MRLEKKQIKKEVAVLHIDAKKLDEYWVLVEFMLREGLKHDGEPMNIEDLKEGIKEGAFQLFTMFGSDADTIEDLAISEGCKKIAVHARPGWQQFLKGKEWKVKRYLYTKELK